MANVKIQKTNDLEHQFLNVLVYGNAGSGKTRLCSTVENGVIISAEGGLLSLREFDIPFIEVASLKDVQNAYEFLADRTNHSFDWVCIDSLSEVGEVVLANEKLNQKDARKAYGELIDRMTNLIRAFRDLPMHVYMTAKVEPLKDELGVNLWGPSMPGNKLGQNLAYFFDAVFAYRIKDVEGETRRALQTKSDGSWLAKDRSGALEPFEEPNLTSILTKIQNQQNKGN